MALSGYRGPTQVEPEYATVLEDAADRALHADRTGLATEQLRGAQVLYRSMGRDDDVARIETRLRTIVRA